MNKLTGHLNTVMCHRRKVIAHCAKAGILWRGLLHDLSKYSYTEFSQGVKYFTGTRSPNEGEREAYGYSLLLPTGFVLQEEDARHMVWQAEGTEETLSVDAFENMGYDAMLADFMDAPTGEVVLESREFGYFSTWGDTFYEVYVAMEGTQWGYILRLDFPAERQGEYLFYGEMIRNAFFVWGGAVG